MVKSLSHGRHVVGLHILCRYADISGGREWGNGGNKEVFLPVFWWQPSPLVVNYRDHILNTEMERRLLVQNYGCLEIYRCPQRTAGRSDAWGCVDGWQEGPSQAEVCKITTLPLSPGFIFTVRSWLPSPKFSLNKKLLLNWWRNHTAAQQDLCWVWFSGG